MKLPVNVFLSAIEQKKVYFFSSEKINITDPHFFICLKRTENDILIMSCCTSQFETVQRFVVTKSLPEKTLVWISPKDPANPFNKDTYVNCNSSQTYTVEEFKSMYEKDAVKYSGEISDDHYHQILIGIKASPLIDNETKDALPDPDSL